MKSASYFLLRTAIARAEWRTPICRLDELQRQLIYLIADEASQGRAVRISTLKLRGEFGTVPTILSRLNGLIEKGLIARLPDPEDGRAHHLTLTPKAKRAILKVSRDVERAAKQLRG